MSRLRGAGQSNSQFKYSRFMQTIRFTLDEYLIDMPQSIL